MGADRRGINDDGAPMGLRRFPRVAVPHRFHAAGRVRGSKRPVLSSGGFSRALPVAVLRAARFIRTHTGADKYVIEKIPGDGGQDPESRP